MVTSQDALVQKLCSRVLELVQGGSRALFEGLGYNPGSDLGRK